MTDDISVVESNEGHSHQSFISKYIFSYDHKMIAKQYLLLGLLMFLVGGLLALLRQLSKGLEIRLFGRAGDRVVSSLGIEGLQRRIEIALLH